MLPRCPPLPNPITSYSCKYKLEITFSFSCHGSSFFPQCAQGARLPECRRRACSLAIALREDVHCIRPRRHVAKSQLSRGKRALISHSLTPTWKSIIIVGWQPGLEHPSHSAHRKLAIICANFFVRQARGVSLSTLRHQAIRVPTLTWSCWLVNCELRNEASLRPG